MKKTLLILWSVGLFFVCLFLNTRHQDFPYHYHPDEPGKVEQVIAGEWNFHHPLLLLGTTKVAMQALSSPTDSQQVVELGRTVSAVFVAGSVVALSLLAFVWMGWPAAFLTGALLATHHQLYELSHYFKEDPSLLFGMSLAALAAWLYSQRPSAARAAFLGAGCALAISGKYLGAASLVFALPLLIQNRDRRGGMIFAATLLAVFLAVNWPLFSALTTFRESFGREVELVVKGQGGTTRSVPHSEYWAIFRDNTTPFLWVLLLAFLYGRWKERRSLNLATWLLIAFPFVYTLALSFSPKSNDRYFLPATAFFTLQAALGASDLAALWPRRWVWPVAAALALAGQFPSYSSSRPGWLAYEAAFRHDDNTDLLEFLRREVPADAVIAMDGKAPLPNPTREKHAHRQGEIPQKIVPPPKPGRFAADICRFDELRSRGITHLVVTENDFGAFFRQALRPKEGREGDFTRRQEFYQRLFAEGELIWERDRGTVTYLHPGLRVYRLR